MKRRLIIFLCACLIGIPAQARLGETLSELTKRYGKPQPAERKNKNAAIWLFEGEDGQLLYSVTFDAKGKSVGEGMKPVRYAKFTPETVQSFIEIQLAPYRDSKTVQRFKPGEKYSFAGKEHTVGAEEVVIVDEANDFLIVWTQGALASVVAIRQMMMR